VEARIRESDDDEAWFSRRGCGAVAGSDTGEGGRVEWTWQSYWQPGTVNQRAFEQFAKDVEEMSDGRIVIQALSVDAIVPPGEMLDAVSRTFSRG
jgi:TRAP-type mannitol/chloroaromatic compound transport system substrate-binding protein